MKRAFVWIIVVVAAVALVPALQAAEDTTPPQIKAFSFSPTSVDVSSVAQTVTLTVRVTDDLSGVAAVYAGFRSPGGAQWANASFYPPPQSGDTKDGVYTSTTTVGKFVEAGTWTLQYISAYDSIGNYVSLNYTQIQAAGFPTDLKVTSQQDASAPVVAGFNFTPNNVDVRTLPATVNLTVHVTDDLSGVAAVYTGFRSPSGAQWANASFYPPPQSGDTYDGVYSGTTSIAKFVEPGTWTAEYLSAYDAVGNYVSLNRSQLEAAGFPTTLEVASNADTHAPVILGFSFTPSAVDTSGGPASVTATVHVTDDVSGVAAVYLGFCSPSCTQWANASFYPPPQSGDAFDGVYSSSTQLQQFAETGTWTLQYMSAYDVVGNYVSLNATQLRSMGPVELLNRKPSIPVAIDIKPGGSPNSISLKSKGTIPVAIFSDASFDAPGSVDTNTLTFGRTGSEASLAFCNRGGEDVNGDGRLDLVCHFNTQNTGFQTGDTVGVLKGKTLTGIDIVGSDSVRIVP